MFCLRAWTPLLIFLTNASPIYVLLFLAATYALQRPCVYCSILLFVLVFSLFDFHADWFEPRRNPAGSNATANALGTSTTTSSSNATLTDSIIETAGLALSALNGTGTTLASAAVDSVKRRIGLRMDGNGSATAFEWLRSILEKKQFRIPCVDVIVRL